MFMAGATTIPPPITDLVDPRTAVPPYRAFQNTVAGLAMPQNNQWTYMPGSIKPADPFGGWTAQELLGAQPAMVPTLPGGQTQIASVSPNTGPPAGGTVIQIFGSGSRHRPLVVR